MQQNMHMQDKSTNKIVTSQILEPCYTIYSYKETQCFVLRDFLMVVPITCIPPVILSLAAD